MRQALFIIIIIDDSRNADNFDYVMTRNLGRVLRLCDPRVVDWIMCQPLDTVLAGFFVTQQEEQQECSRS